LRSLRNTNLSALKKMKKTSLLFALCIACFCNPAAQQTSLTVYAKDTPAQSLAKIQAKYPFHIRDNTTQAVFHYSPDDRTKTVYEDVFVEVPCDTDEDGKRDLVKIKVIRPAESGIIINQTTGETLISLPVLMEHSPYRNVPRIDSAARTTPVHNVRHEQQEAAKDNMPAYQEIKTAKPRAAEWYFGHDAVAWDKATKQWKNGNSGDWTIPASRGDRPVVFQGVNTQTQSNPNPTYQYFYTRGYAIVISASIGNTFDEDESEGLTNCGDVEETLVPMAIIKWLNGEVKGYTDRSATMEVKATWCNGNVAMTGQSYVGTLPQATACSGVKGLKAILPIAAISNWYDYYRGNGAVVAPYNYQGEDADVLIDVCYGPLMIDFYKKNTNGAKERYTDWIAQVHKEQDRITGDYNAFWDKRNYLTTVNNVRDDCGIMIMHGLNDWNVKTKQPDQFYRALKNAGKTVKMVWHLGGHATVWNRFDSHYLTFYHLWLDHFLYGIDNNAVERIPEISVPNANNVNWEFYDAWPVAGAERKKFYLGAVTSKAGGLLRVPLAGQPVESATFRDNYDINAGIRPNNNGDLTAWENRLFNPKELDVQNSERLIFATEPLEKPLRLNGTVTVTLDISANKGKGSISAVLVEVGPNYRTFGTVNTPVVLNSGHGEANITLDNYIINNVLSDYKIISRGYADVQNPNPTRETYLNASATTGYIPAYYYQTKTIIPGQRHEYTFIMQPVDYTFKAGTRLALYIFSTDYRSTIIPQDATDFTLYMSENSFVELPIVPTYSIFYNANGGSSLYDALGGYSDSYPKDGQSIKSRNFGEGGYRIVGGMGDSTVVKLNHRAAYTFAGWNTKADGSGIAYQPNDRITDNQMTDLTLYAQWRETEITATLTNAEKSFLSLLNYEHVDKMSQYLTTEIGNRYTSTFRRDMAADWIMSELKSYGYKPYIHEFENNRYTNNGIFEAGGKKYIYYGPAYDTETVYQFTNSTVTITGAEVLNWQDVHNPFVIPSEKNLANKAIIITLDSEQAPNTSAALVPSAANYYAACLTLQNAGAKAVIFVTPAPRNDWNTSYSRIVNTQTGAPITIPVGLTLHYETYPILSSLSNNTEVKLTMETRRDGKNVLATLPSSTGSQKNVYITAHFDTTISGPGMNDNASGTVMTLEMARAFKDVKFEHNLVFFLCDAEETGLSGARAYCMNMTDEERKNFAANYNMDMIATAQEDCIHFFLNINDTSDPNISRLRTIQNALANDRRLIDVPEAFALAQQRDVFNHTYLAAQKLGFDMNRFNICWDTTTDHWAFVQESTRAGNNFPNLMNAVEFDWRRNEKGTSFEALYHKVGDTYEKNFAGIMPQGSPSMASASGLGVKRMKTAGDIISLAIYYSAIGSMTN